MFWSLVIIAELVWIGSMLPSRWWDDSYVAAMVALAWICAAMQAVRVLAGLE